MHVKQADSVGWGQATITAFPVEPVAERHDGAGPAPKEAPSSLPSKKLANGHVEGLQNGHCDSLSSSRPLAKRVLIFSPHPVRSRALFLLLLSRPPPLVYRLLVSEAELFVVSSPRSAVRDGRWKRKEEENILALMLPMLFEPQFHFLRSSPFQ